MKNTIHCKNLLKLVVNLKVLKDLWIFCIELPIINWVVRYIFICDILKKHCRKTPFTWRTPWQKCFHFKLLVADGLVNNFKGFVIIVCVCTFDSWGFNRHVSWYLIVVIDRNISKKLDWCPSYVFHQCQKDILVNFDSWEWWKCLWNHLCSSSISPLSVL